MKTAKEILSKVNAPIIKDMFGNEIYPGDIIGMTTTASRQIVPYIVTDKTSTSGSGSVVLIHLINNHWRSVLNPKELNKDTSKCYQTQTIVKLNNDIPAYLLEKAKQAIDTLHQNDASRKIQAKEKLKTAVQSRNFVVLLHDKNTNQMLMQIYMIQSKPGKVISKVDIEEKLQSIYNNVQDKYNMYIYDDKLGFDMYNKHYNHRSLKLHLESINYTCSSWLGRESKVEFWLGMLDRTTHSWNSLKNMKEVNDWCNLGAGYQITARNNYSVNNYENKYMKNANWNNTRPYYLIENEKNKQVDLSYVFRNQSMLNDFINLAHNLELVNKAIA